MYISSLFHPFSYSVYVEEQIKSRKIYIKEEEKPPVCRYSIYLFAADV